ncbi:hypothetical protein KUTeg_015277 [Tegillarca granosa]|uniref:PiggyBac transposable element-derived protein domain-containing protein n=1 Tax=Tegillarca granosa TaxID=220873 RepID=A0ABQ9EPN5_TEGGR|nr:hypothetical protein KUTeg_015277 [Tegillarca granosa]
MGIIKKASIPQYWNSTLSSQISKWFKTVIPRNRFQNIIKYLHVADYKRNVARQHPAYDPASRFSPLLNYMNRQFLRYIIPNRNLCVDETLISCKGHSVMRQYIPSKAAKYGIKFWVLCEAATGYILQMHIYRGKHFDPKPNGQLQGTNVVYDLLRNTNLLNKGYHVICDSFFSSLHLANKLLEARTYVTGTLRKNRPMPQTIKNANPAPGSAIYMRKGQVVCLAYRGEEDKTPVRLLSTLLPAQELPTHRPRIIQQYNKHMGAVDLDDAILSAYSGEHRKKKVWQKVIFHLFHRIMLNSYFLYKRNTSDNPPMSHLKFIQMVIESLANVCTQIPRARQRPHRLQLDILPGRKERDCCVCSSRSQGVRRRSRTICSHL